MDLILDERPKNSGNKKNPKLKQKEKQMEFTEKRELETCHTMTRSGSKTFNTMKKN